MSPAFLSVVSRGGSRHVGDIFTGDGWKKRLEAERDDSLSVVQHRSQLCSSFVCRLHVTFLFVWRIFSPPPLYCYFL